MKTIHAELLTIGDELLYGQIVDTNSQWMGAELASIGIKVIRKTTVGDVAGEILTAFAEAEKRADIVLITGGLGPTNDDLTKPCLARYFDCEMRMHEEALAEVTEFFASRGRVLTEVNRLQALLPVCCEKVTNRLGTAPGMWFQRNGRVFVSMPGVPHEMKVMMREIILPRLKEAFQPPAIHHRIIRTAGIGESFLAEKIAAWEQSLPQHFRLAYLPGYGEVKLRLTAIGENIEKLKHEAEDLAGRLQPLIGEYIYGAGDEPLEVVVGNLLRNNKLTLAIAESCTGGYLSHLVTSVPGSSDYFAGSIVAYSNDIKINNLGVSKVTLDTSGAVSEAAIREMAQQVRSTFRTDIGVATSGIAGPGGGSAEKPVGTVWIACANHRETIVRRLQLSKDRIINIRLSSFAALNMIRTVIQNPA